MAGVFIAFEGPEGAGKSTQVERLAGRLQSSGIEPVITREPGGTPAGDAIRTVVLDPSLQVAPMTEFLLYCASRAQHVEELLRPALYAGSVVVTDRFAGASIAYQGHGRGLDLEFIDELTARVTGGLAPHLTVLMDIDPARGLERIASRGATDRLERANLAFHERVRRGFLEQASRQPDSWLVLDAERPAGELETQIWERVSSLLGERTG